MNPPEEPRRILLIRRDNIGDLVLVTPLIHALRERFPAAWIGVLGNSYNTPVLAHHPEIDQVFAYDKAKHRPDCGRLAVYTETLRMLLRLRAHRIDIAMLAGPGAQRQAARLARWVKPRTILGFVEGDAPAGVSLAVPYGDGAGLHEAEDVFRLGKPLGIEGSPGPCRLGVDQAEMARVREALHAAGAGRRRVVGVHLSARRERQRWPAGHFASLIETLQARGDLFFLLLWSPGASDDPRHPGDDAKARAVLDALAKGAPCLAWPTSSLPDLAAALAQCSLLVCADGGAMHVGAGLNRPIVAMFGDSPVHRWRPWGVPHAVLQSPSGDVGAIGVGEVAAACERLLAEADGTAGR